MPANEDKSDDQHEDVCVNGDAENDRDCRTTIVQIEEHDEGMDALRALGNHFTILRYSIESVLAHRPSTHLSVFWQF